MAAVDSTTVDCWWLTHLPENSNQKQKAEENKFSITRLFLYVIFHVAVNIILNIILS